jgi:hypothetical protein
VTDPIPPLPGLRWAVKRSFMDYVRRMPDGRAAVADGAKPVDDDQVLFAPDPSVPPPAEDLDRFWAFSGQVWFDGHAGLLFVQVSAPWIALRGDTAELTVADTLTGGRLSLVTLRLEPGPSPADGVEVWHGTDVALTPAGVPVFNDVYPPGEPFEPLTIVVTG